MHVLRKIKLQAISCSLCGRYTQILSHDGFFFFFFLTSNGHSITRAWSGLGNQTRIEQPIKCNFLWKDRAVLAKKSENWLCARGSDVEIREAIHQRLYPLQFRRKARSDMRFLYHCYQLLAVCPKALADWVLKHVLYCPPQSFYFRMQSRFSSIKISCPQHLNVSSTIPPDPSTSTKLSRGCPGSI